MYVDDSGISCGVMLITDIGKATEKDFKVLVNGIEAPRDKYYNLFGANWVVEPLWKGYTYIFSDAVKNGNGQRLADFIKKHKLGTLIVTRPRKNPNSGNKIRVWIWHYNGKRVK